MTRVVVGHSGGSSLPGRNAAVLLVGEPGVGKTRLLQTLSEWARSSGWSVSIGTAYPMTRGVPYAPLSEALDPLVRDLDPATISGMVRGALQELSSVLPSLASERAPNRADAGDELQPRVMWTVTRLLERLAARRPLLLAIDNLQWSDHATLELLHFAVRQAPRRSAGAHRGHQRFHVARRRASRGGRSVAAGPQATGRWRHTRNQGPEE